MSHKRKGHEYSSAVTASVSSQSTVGNNNNNNRSNNNEWWDTRQELKQVRSSFSVQDLLTSLDSCVSFQRDLEHDQLEAVLETSQAIKNKLNDRIEMAQEACKEESDDLYRRKLTIEQLQTDKEALVQQLQDIDALTTLTKDNILRYQQEASQHVELLDQVEAEQMDQVPRLKRQISLYATTTGIKWDFDQQYLLAGQVAVHPKGSIRRFCIDPNEYSNFEIANHLWSLMENGKYADLLIEAAGPDNEEAH